MTALTIRRSLDQFLIDHEGTSWQLHWADGKDPAELYGPTEQHPGVIHAPAETLAWAKSAEESALALALVVIGHPQSERPRILCAESGERLRFGDIIWERGDGWCDRCLSWEPVDDDGVMYEHEAAR